jgi:large subunit ribosomal protein L15
MQLHELKRKHPNKKKKPRIGRGGKRGDYSGRGVKGQRARAGHRIRPAERDFLQRLPKFRGQKNKPTSPKFTAVNLSDLEKVTKKGTVLTQKSFDKAVKILSKGTISKPIKIINIPVSKAAREKIEAAGGTVVTQ